MASREFSGEGDVRFVIESLDLTEGTYKLDVAAHNKDGYPYDYHRLLYTFRVKSRTKDVGIYRPRHHWEFSPAIQIGPADRYEPAGPVTMNPSFTVAAALEVAERARAETRRVVFTNGVYDLLHPGHIRYLRAARRLGDVLVVGVNSDRSARQNKGPARPLVPAAERAELIAALACVDAVVVFDEDTPYAVISQLRPDVLVKGADWPADQIVGRDVVEAHGGKVVRIPVETGHSTSALIDRILSESSTSQSFS
jgi:D-beta-D-heptose 7-phosphate kinase/D-beta-D-heptose 1-phosphate adenosyltransferase